MADVGLDHLFGYFACRPVGSPWHKRPSAIVLAGGGQRITSAVAPADHSLFVTTPACTTPLTSIVIIHFPSRLL
ncbi:Hypothetical protein NTJ_03388 [Nesidiocoris tenuis]|uniref:EAL domain-containing protein n=1 Tax=Nesidiocoris tenuis TaxID=355587 RepID=A0ABN7AE91_9HEMI|nr:Hypothetical protein NTJ_03388 [Nesidiocoris tenuis]